MGPLSAEDVGALALQLAKANKLEWDDRIREADKRIYGWKMIALEVERMKGVPCSVKTLRRWWKSRRFPIDVDPLGYSVRRFELDRWLHSRPHLPT